jgi:hypothetical protein
LDLVKKSIEVLSGATGRDEMQEIKDSAETLSYRELEKSLVSQEMASTSGKVAKPFWRRSFPLALGLFVLINLGGQLAFDEEKAGMSKARQAADFWTNPALIDIARREFAAQTPCANVVLLGSSLIMFPFWAMDVEHNAGIADIAHYHRSLYLEKALNAGNDRRKRVQAGVFSLASAGQMGSDAFLYVNELLKGPRAPKCLVWGIAPRDFGDANVPNPMVTPSFQKLVNLSNFNYYKPIFLPRFDDQAEFVANRACFIYGKRLRVQKEVDKLLERANSLLAGRLSAGNKKPKLGSIVAGEVAGAGVAALAGSGGDANINTPTAGVGVSDGTNGGARRTVVNVLVAGGTNDGAGGGANVSVAGGANIGARLDAQAYAQWQAVEKQRWELSVKEYRERYRKIGERDLSEQLNFLKKVVTLCKERGISLVLVNMPLSKRNLELLPPDFYDQYRHNIATILVSSRSDAKFVDLGSDTSFTDADFWDTVHMNHAGGKKLVEKISPFINAHL